ncbi:MAG: hypothetical protein K2X87_10345 [Gemmataceae bacterium]|nr:hypothetical protein [Gemmataceae bacterium]
MVRLIGLLPLAAGLLLASGCSDKPKLVPVAGTVTLKGGPVTAGSIWFTPDPANPYRGEKPSCQLQLDGSFVMRTYPWGDGVPPGGYKVTLSLELAKRLNKPAYADPARTPWAVEVSAEGLADKVFEVK